jgi:phosphoribosyl 1,2-cyclic phosphate phosphodiesterase
MEGELIFLGSGTSMGVPTLGCECNVCTSTDPRDKRLRPSVMVRWEDHCVLIDTGPDFREQALRHKIRNVDAVLYTHAHADHILGLDDLRPLSFLRERNIPLYAEEAAAQVLERVYDYTFAPDTTYKNRARVELCRLGNCIEIFGILFQRIRLLHGTLEVAGFRFGKAAYLTDMSSIPEESLSLLDGLEVLVLDALRRKYHPSHSTLPDSIEWARKIRPQQTYFTHMSHDLGHVETESTLPEGMWLAYDGLKVPFTIA